MMTQESAAKYFIVAWVKEWSLRTYLDTVAEGESIEFEDAHKAFPWLPAQVHWFVSKGGKGQFTRRYVAEAAKRINDLLWDAPDNKARLDLWPHVLKIHGAATKMSVCDAQKELQASNKAYAKSQLAHHVQTGLYKRGSKGNGAWGVVK